MKILTTTTAFDETVIESGDLIVLGDREGNLIGSGIILAVNPLELYIALHAPGIDVFASSFNESLQDQVSPFRLRVEEVMNGDYKPLIYHLRDATFDA